MSSSGSPTMAIVWPNGALSPSLIRIFRNTPADRACISIVALSVSISASGSPIETLSPSFFNQRETWPSSMVGERFGMMTFVAINQRSEIRNQQLYISHFAHGSGDLIGARQREIFKVLCIRHRYV